MPRLSSVLRPAGLLALWPLAPLAAQSPADRVAAAVDSATIEAHVRFLSSDLLEGRAPGTRGGELAAAYLEAQFRRLGLEPAGEDGTYRHQIPVISLDPTPSLSLGGETLAWKDDFVLWSMRNEERVAVEAEAVFAGHGIVAPEFDWDDYAGADVRGKVVVVLVNDPGLRDSSLFEGERLTYYGRWTYKIEEAARQGAAGILLVHTPESATYGWGNVSGSWTGPQVRIETPATPLVAAGWLQEAAATGFLRAAGQDPQALVAAAGRRGFRAVQLGLGVRAEVTSRIQRSITHNLLARLPGAGPAAGEAVLIGGHYDHLGIGLAVEGDSIYNGAVDNAAGVAAVLATAEAFVRSGVVPGRSLLFIGFGAEESGLLGSSAFAERPTLPLRQLAAVLNIDGLSLAGPTRDMGALGADQSALGEHFRAAAAAEALTVTKDEEAERKGYFFRSDHFPLVKAGVPALSFQAGVEVIGQPEGFGEEYRRDYAARRYHQPADQWDAGARVGGIVQAARVAARIALAVGAAPGQPAWHPASGFRAAGEARLQAP